MTIIEAVLKNAVKIDFSQEFLYSEDQVYLDTPVRFPTVNVGLVDTIELCRIADSIRMEKGMLPFFPEDEESEYDDDGYYDFYFGFNGISDNNMNSVIEFTVQCDNAPDDWERYTIDIDETSQNMMRIIFENQLKEHETSIKEMLKEALKEMVDYAEA